MSLVSICTASPCAVGVACLTCLLPSMAYAHPTLGGGKDDGVTRRLQRSHDGNALDQNVFPDCNSSSLAVSYHDRGSNLSAKPADTKRGPVAPGEDLQTSTNIVTRHGTRFGQKTCKILCNCFS
mmetsp:Transcript_17500/g.41030  ORF Transcript_17500/g.41030 Transcript_17500/m.41030 type:complete len:124 (-) Transcript_17500:184-555(-)